LEVIVVDGGSTDDTRKLAVGFPQVRLLLGPKGRGLQMNVGALNSRGEFLLFLHADTVLTDQHLYTLRRLSVKPGFAAGAFELCLTPPRPALRFIAWGANWRCRLFGLPYGDQALVLKREVFFALGGYSHRRPEDLDLVIRLKRLASLHLLGPPLPSSARRWLKKGYFATTLNNWLFLSLHLLERLFTSRWPAQGDLWGAASQLPPQFTPGHT
jgi:glycosyltransferase involved in cell wall biosynthesis